MSETTVRQSVASTREQIWLNREQVRKEKPVYRALKRAQDIFFSLLALIVLSPLLLIVAIAIVIDDPKGSPIFTQVRSGLDGKEFRIHKFRSMCVDAEAKLADLKLHTEMNGPILSRRMTRASPMSGISSASAALMSCPSCGIFWLAA